MKNFKSIFKNYDLINIAVIICFMVILSVLISNHLYFLFPDRGREFFIPEEILKGKALYKDITCIYFPLAYYINSLIYFILGVSVNSLILSQTIFCIIYAVVYYFCSRFFLDKFLSLLISILVIFSCVFSSIDIFNYMTPYSYALTYGTMGVLFCTFLLIKLFRTDNIKYLYYAAVIAGFTFSCKLEFAVIILLMITALCLYKKLSISQYLKTILCFSLIPLITISVVFLQGVSINDIKNAINFGISFSKTEAMTSFLSATGMYPAYTFDNIYKIFKNSLCIISLILLCFAVLKLAQRLKKIYIIILITPILLYCFSNDAITHYWYILPILTFLIFCLKFKTITNKLGSEYLILITASLLISLRVFFMLSISNYGVYVFPLLILAFVIMIKELLPNCISEINTKDLICYIFVVLIGLYTINICDKILYTNYLIATDKGSIYTDKDSYTDIMQLMNYIENNIDEKSDMLILPEGNLINFLMSKKINPKCFMLDRLYHDAYGEQAAKDIIKDLNSEYIILVKGFMLSDFSKIYLYDEETPLKSYIDENYNVIKVFDNNIDKITVLKIKSQTK